MNGKLFSKLAIALFLLVLSLGFVSALDGDNETLASGNESEGAGQPIDASDEIDSSSNDTNDRKDEEVVSIHGGDEASGSASADGEKTTVNTYKNATGNPFLALAVVIVCLVLVRYRD